MAPPSSLSSLDQARLLARVLSVLAKHCYSSPSASAAPYALRLLAHNGSPLVRDWLPRLPALGTHASTPRFFRTFASDTENEGKSPSQARATAPPAEPAARRHRSA